MAQEIIYKQQGDGRDSWTVKTIDENGDMVSCEMVYEDPNKKPIPSVDVIGIIKALSPDELNQLKALLK